MRNALVIATYGKFFLIQNDDLVQVKCTKRTSITNIVVGDNVLYEESVIIKVLDRDNLLTNKHKNIAANIDIMFITLAIKPYPNLISIDSYLLKAENLGILPIILLNKIDLKIDNKITNLIKTYKDLGYKVLEISANLQTNFLKLKALIKDKTCIFVGHSGVGKSSIINTLTNSKQKVNILGSDGLGTHTTTNSTMFFTCGGRIIDTPGVREFNPNDFSLDEIKKGFIEINNLKDKCKFNNCNHLTEPGCEVLKQLELGNINKHRYQNYTNLITEVL